MNMRNGLMSGAAAIAMMFAMPQAAWSQTTSEQQEQVPPVELPPVTEQAPATDQQAEPAQQEQAPTGQASDQAKEQVEENAGNINITVVRLGGLSGTITVDYSTTNDTAVAGVDYTPASGTFTNCRIPGQ